MFKMTLKLAVCLLACVLAAPDGSATQTAKGARNGPDLAQTPLEGVRLEAQGIAGLFSQLSLRYDIPVGLEVAQDEDATAAYQLNFRKGTLSELLTQFAAEHDRYAWRIDGGVVSVFPKDSHRDQLLRELLTTELNNFSVKEKTDCQMFAKSLLNAPEVREALEGYGLSFDTGSLGGFYIQQLGQRFSRDFSGAQLKAILDRVIKESPAARFWVIRRDRAMQELSLRVKAKLEDPPNFNGGSDVPHQNPR